LKQKQGRTQFLSLSFSLQRHFLLSVFSPSKYFTVVTPLLSSHTNSFWGFSISLFRQGKNPPCHKIFDCFTHFSLL
jgi:hypothetical protein